MKLDIMKVSKTGDTKIFLSEVEFYSDSIEFTIPTMEVPEENTASVRLPLSFLRPTNGGMSFMEFDLIDESARLTFYGDMTSFSRLTSSDNLPQM
jgi:hypothetical protein